MKSHLLIFTAPFTNSQTYNTYVSGKAANFRSAPTLSSEVQKKLKQYTNITVNDSASSKRFAKIEYNG
tara:strand:- start:310 stop:513 length:204 start_codon:yes stop_codon:yes gene_type:complete